MTETQHLVGAVVLAAGASARMGTLKALLPWRGTTLAGYVVGELLQAPIERIVVVTGNGADEVVAAVPQDPRVAFVANDRWEDGKAGSVVCGVGAIPDGHHLLIAAIDQPRPVSLIAGLISAHTTGLVDGRVATIAGYGVRRGHPIVFVSEIRSELLVLDEATAGMRAVVTRHTARVRVADLGDPAALVNLNTPEEYTAAVTAEAGGTTHPASLPPLAARASDRDSRRIRG